MLYLCHGEGFDLGEIFNSENIKRRLGGNGRYEIFCQFRDSFKANGDSLQSAVQKALSIVEGRSEEGNFDLNGATKTLIPPRPIEVNKTTTAELAFAPAAPPPLPTIQSEQPDKFDFNDALWIYHVLGRVNAGEEVLPVEAPSQGAWGYLQYLRLNPKEQRSFYEKVLEIMGKMIKVDTGSNAQQKRQDIEEMDETIKKVDKILEGIKKK